MSGTRPSFTPATHAASSGRTRPAPAAVTEAEAEAYVHGICFKTGPPRLIGTELEWFLYDEEEPARHLPRHRLTEAVDGLHRLPLRAAITCEPGGQVELSSRPAPSLGECVEQTAADLVHVRRHLASRGIRLQGHGHDPWRPPRRVLDLPRYVAMEQYFDRAGRTGRSMMCSTASVQVCVDAGTEEPGPQGYAARWRLAHLLGPVLVAVFANSPLSEGRPTGWRSTRQAVWARLDPPRTTAPTPGPDPRAAWARHALDTPLLCVPRSDGRPWTAPEGLTFRDWIRQAAAGTDGPPTLESLRYHLTTLFPPVRPQGHLELRMIDAQPGDDGWMVPLAVVGALFADPVAHEEAVRATLRLGPDGGAAPGNSLWLRAAQCGLEDAALRRAAEECFRAARHALRRLDAPGYIRAAVAEFTARYVARGRCPADDLLDTARGARPVPDAPAVPPRKEYRT